MSMEFKPDALKDFPDWKTSNNQEGLQGRLEGRIFDEPVSIDGDSLTRLIANRDVLSMRVKALK